MRKSNEVNSFAKKHLLYDDLVFVGLGLSSEYQLLQLRASKAAVDPQPVRKSVPALSEHRKVQTTVPALNLSALSFSPEGADEGSAQEGGTFSTS